MTPEVELIALGCELANLNGRYVAIDGPDETAADADLLDELEYLFARISAVYSRMEEMIAEAGHPHGFLSAADEAYRARVARMGRRVRPSSLARRPGRG